MNSRELKTKILENWFAIDSILFNDHAKYVIKEGRSFREYISLKGALLSNLYEFYNHIGYTPVIEEDNFPKNEKALIENSRQSSIYAKKLAATTLSREDVKGALKKKIVREAKERNVKDPAKFSKLVAEQKFRQISLDNILIGIPILECQNRDKMDDVKGQILEDAYKMMRDQIVKLAESCTKISSKG